MMHYTLCLSVIQGFLESQVYLVVVVVVQVVPVVPVVDNSNMIICLLTAELVHQTPLTRASSGSSSTGQSQGSPGITSHRHLTTNTIN